MFKFFFPKFVPFMR